MINSQILEQLQQIRKRLDKIKNGDCKKTSDKSKIKGGKGLAKSKKVVTTKLKQQTEKHDNKLPTFDSIREDAMIQSKVKQCLQELFSQNRYGSKIEISKRWKC